MTPIEQASLLQIRIDQMKVEIDKVLFYVDKINNLKKDEMIKKRYLEQNLEHLKRKGVIAIMDEYAKARTAIKQININIANHVSELEKLRKGIDLQQKAINDLELQKAKILDGSENGTNVLEFKRK
jgi:hypothetical protein